MKKINIRFVLPLCFLLAAGMSFFMSSCRKNSEVGGTPSITRIRMPQASKADSQVVKALPGTSIIIEGINLSNAKEVFFNDYPAFFNPTYNTSTHIWVTVPPNTPTPDRFPNVTNKIKVVTTAGVAEFNFPVIPPAPLIDSVLNENALPGTNLVMRGRYFFAVKEAWFPNNETTTEVTTNETGTEIYIKVPAGLGSTYGRVALLSEYGNDTTDVLINNIDGIGVVSNFDNNSYYRSGATEITDNSSLFPANRGKYYRSSILALGAWDKKWWDPGRGAVFGNYNATWKKVLDNAAIAALNNLDTLKNFSLKFEINTKTVWDKNLLFRISFNQKYGYSFQPWLFYKSAVFNTENTWITFTIPLSEFKTVLSGNDHYPPNPTGAAVTKLSDLFNTNGEFTNLLFRTQTENNSTAAMQFAIDNVRIVRMKN